VRIRTRLLAGLGATALLMTACGTDETMESDEPAEDVAGDPAEDGVDDPVGDDAAEDDPVGDDGEDDAAAADGEVLAIADSDVGEHLVDVDGMTVYLHMLDEQDEATCLADCAAVWIPVAADDDPTVDEALDQDLVGTIEREDADAVGIDRQVTYAGQPLYTFLSDDDPGDVNGQEVGRIWFVVGPDGEPIGDVPGDEELEELDMSDVEG
jgi:predicted lipoprotein with Yx(FWY)xxD motif